MNERIQELAKQAGLEGSNGHYEYDWFDPDKFAELIVGECAEIALTDGQATGNFEVFNKITKHFRVER
jgi:hypothetical protein